MYNNLASMFLTFFCVFLHLLPFVFSVDVCLAQNPCECFQSSEDVINLSTVGTDKRPRFSEVFAKGTTQLYSYNPCFAFDSSDSVVVDEKNKPCKQAAACVKTPDGEHGNLPEEHVIGQQSKAKFRETTELGLHIYYSVEGASQTLIVQLKCDANGTIPLLEITSPESDKNPQVIMSLTSKCACANLCSNPEPDPEPSGLSTGSKLLITFFTITICYFAVGMIWNFCNGAKGIELVPNVDFWNDVPKLIVEGVAFTCTCFSRNRSYGEV